MSRFYGSMTGSAKTQVTRQGGTSSGVNAHVRGWDLGGRVVIRDDNGEDVVEFYATSGSNGGQRDRLLVTLRMIDGDVVPEYSDRMGDK